MRADPPTVRHARPEDRAAAVRALARAFDRDPLASFFLRADGRRAQAFEATFDAAFQIFAPPFGARWISDDGQGVALWMRATPPIPWRALRELPRLAGAVGVSRLPMVLASLARIEARHPRAPHAYLFAIGVDPDAQGRGLGGALMRAALADLDARGEAAYLEASTEDNARLYARHGFAETESLVVAEGGPTLRLMWRDGAPARP